MPDLPQLFPLALTYDVLLVGLLFRRLFFKTEVSVPPYMCTVSACIWRQGGTILFFTACVLPACTAISALTPTFYVLALVGAGVVAMLAHVQRDHPETPPEEDDPLHTAHVSVAGVVFLGLLAVVISHAALEGSELLRGIAWGQGGLTVLTMLTLLLPRSIAWCQDECCLDASDEELRRHKSFFRVDPNSVASYAAFTVVEWLNVLYFLNVFLMFVEF